MESNELMIGDWVRNDLGETQQVVELREEGVMLYYNDIYPYDDVQPIPLTPEILEKNGFKETGVIVVGTRKMRWVSEYTRTEITIWLDDTMPMEIVKNIYYEDEESYTLPFPGTVHELQHALRLCGITKEIQI